MERVQFKKAIDYHLAWKARLRNFLDGRERITEEEAVSHQGCALGKWLHSDSASLYGDISEYRELKKTHRKLHEIVVSILTLKYSGKRAEAESKLKTMEGLSDRVVALIHGLRKKIESRTGKRL